MSYNFFDTVGGHEFTDGTVPALVDAVAALNSTQKDTNELLAVLVEELKHCKKEIRELEKQIALLR